MSLEEKSFMRTALFAAVVPIASLLGVLGGEHQTVAQTSRRTDKLIERSEAFETLVNPNCSHCVDEAKRRAGQLRDTDRVLAWIRGKYDGGAIPVRYFLAPYRVISDTYGVFVYDPDAGYMRGFEPSLDFRFHGWRNGVMVIRHKDGTLYSALSGKAFDGPRKGDQLRPVATLATQWGDWLDRYPGTVAYHMFEKYQPVDLPRDDNADSVATRGIADPRLPAAEDVLGVAIDGQARAYPLAVLEKSGGVIVDTFAGQKVFVLWYPPTRTAAIYAAEVEDSEQTPLVTLTADSKESSTPFTDRETGSRWDIAGRALSGELKGKTLRWLPSVQCRWFAWAAEYPETEIAGKEAVQPAAKDDQRDSVSQNLTGSKPLDAVIVSAGDVTSDNVAAWTQAGQRAVVVVLDESVTAAAYQKVAATVSRAKLDLYYWIEVARNTALADAHPRWMASLGTHGDWQQRFPGVRLPVKGQEVAKAYPWVPIGYREAFDAHLARINQLVQRAAEPYRGVLLNDLQGGPASCGCGNLQCRWAIDYGVPATATALTGNDVAVRFVTEVRKLAPGKNVIPIWMTECEHDDLPQKLLAGAASTGLCGSVPCATGTCPKVFAQQWSPLVADGNSPIGLLVLQKELERNGPQYAASAWAPKAVEYVDTIPAQLGGKVLPHERLWLVLQGYDVSATEQAAARAAALQSNPAAIVVALTRLDQSYEPRVIPVKH
jgi:hypothetical protein